MRTALPVVLGNALEFYDFTIYAYFAAILGRQFFPADRPVVSLLLALAGYSAGFLARPFGALLIGRLADVHGRRRGLLVTILLMGLGTALIALCPPYASIGLAAPLLVLLGRLLQGFSAGAEVGVASAWLMEMAHPRDRCYWVSWQLASQGAAALASALVATLLHLTLSPQAVETWGWRLAFGLGLSIVPMLFYIRRHLPETRPPAPHAWRGTELLRTHRVILLSGIALAAGGTIFVQASTHYLPIHLAEVLGFPQRLSFLVSCAVGASLLSTAPLFGRLCDRLPRRKPVQRLTLWVCMLCIVPVFALLNAGQSLWLSVLLITLLMTVCAASAGATFVMLMDAFPPHLRATGLSLVYGVAVTLFGGTALLVMTWLVELTGSPMAPAWYAALGCALSLFALGRFREDAAAPAARASG
ncbi:MAG: MFS transporter [Pseudomonas sp.]